MPRPNRQPTSESQWNAAAADFELGTKHAAQIARELGVSPATVSREFKRRGCRKASRVAEVVADLHVKLDEEAREKAKRREAEATARAAVMDALVGELMDTPDAADKAGELASANAKVARISRALSMAMR